MKSASILIAVAILASAGVAFAQAGNSSDSSRSNRSDPSQMTTPPAGTTSGVPDRSMEDRRLDNRSSVLPRDRDDRRSVNRRGNSIPNEPADPSQMTTPPAGATPSGQGG